jgi:hypothetical protein
MPLNIVISSPSKAKAILREAYELKESVMIHGNPGIGKTDMFEQFNMELGEPGIGGEMHTILLTQIESCDIRGIPNLDQETRRTTWFPPDFLPEADKPAAVGVILLDEFTAAEVRLQKSGYQLLLKRQVGEWRCPDGFLIGATGNTGADGAVVYQMDSPAANRMIHILMVANQDDWVEWALANDIANEVISYIKFRPDSLDGNDKMVKADQLLGPTPRGWARLSKYIKRGVKRDLLEPIAAGILGQDTAYDFMQVYDEVTSFASVAQIVQTKGERRLKMFPTSIPGMYNLVYGLAAYVKDDNYDDVIEVATTIPKLQTISPSLPLAEFETLAMELILTKIDSFGPYELQKVTRIKEYTKYHAKRQKVGLAKPR